MTIHIYTNIIGTFAYDGSGIKTEMLFSDSERLKNIGHVLKGDFKSPLLQKYPDAVTDGMPSKALLNHLYQQKYLKLMRQASLALTRKQIKESLRPEHLIIQAVNAIDDIDKVANGLAKREREWYELYNPEFSRTIDSHEKFVELIQKKSKSELLKEAGVSEDDSMGAEVEEDDRKPMMGFAAGIESLYRMRDAQAAYVEEAMKKHLPNVTAVAGAQIGGKLLAHAGSLERLALLPASTIQLLGAEKALFRHITTGAKSPKYGVIINHPLVTKRKAGDKGKAARMLADKISIAAKIDFFKGEFRGEELKKELEKRLGI